MAFERWKKDVKIMTLVRKQLSDIDEQNAVNNYSGGVSGTKWQRKNLQPSGPWGPTRKLFAFAMNCHCLPKDSSGGRVARHACKAWQVAFPYFCYDYSLE